VRLWVSTSIWTAESDQPLLLARSGSGEEAMAKLWLMLHQAKTAAQYQGQA
jgi:hypothetical protein